MKTQNPLQILAAAPESWISAALVVLLLMVFVGFGYALSAKDIASHRLPNKMVGQWLAASLTLLILLGLAQGVPQQILQGLLGMVILGLGYLLMHLVSAGAMGMGDVKLAAVLGLNIGYFSLAGLLLATIITFVSASLFVLGGTILRKLTLKSAVPFGPFMVTGALAAVLMAR